MHGSTWNWCLFEAQVVQKSQWSIWQIIRLIILRSGFNSHETFGQWLEFLTYLTHLLSHNLGKLKCCSPGFYPVFLRSSPSLSAVNCSGGCGVPLYYQSRSITQSHSITGPLLLDTQTSLKWNCFQVELITS